MKGLRLIGLLVIALVGLTMVVSPVLAEDQKVFKVGLCLTFSGPAGSWGAVMSNGYKLVADHINAQGGLNIGGEKYKIVLVEGDDKFTAEGAATVARRLIEKDKVNMILGGIVSQTCLGMQEVTEPAKVITLSTAYSNDTISKSAGVRYNFRAPIFMTETMPAMFEWLRTTYPDKKRIAQIDLNYDSAWIHQALVNEVAPKFGYEVVYEGYWEGGTKDYYPWLVKAMAKKFDILYNASSNPEFALLIKQARELGFTGLALEDIPMLYNEMVDIAGAEAMEGLIDITAVTEGPSVNDRIKAYRDLFIEEYGYWSAYPLICGSPFDAILQAFEAAGSLDPEKVIAVLESGRKWETYPGYDGLFGGTEVYGQPRQWLAPTWIRQVQGGKVVPVYEITVEEMINNYKFW